ncbi:MAG: SRPBCC family protein [Alphaproteobacteria bacterium]|nr:SRPBCC family protein [Alphaproteobacteria bacterium]MBV9692174.1 SRPBCC family protein [Alphaproteobacteria bacterium]
MASIRKEFHLAAAPEAVWDALADFGALHERLVPGFVIDTRLDGNARIVTFANGAVARETLVSSDAARRRLVYCIAPNERIAHYNGSAEVLADGKGTRFVWTVDLLPDRLADYVSSQMELGAEAMKKAFAG